MLKLFGCWPPIRKFQPFEIPRLLGEFEFSANRVMGWARSDDYPGHSNLTINAIKHRKIVASTAAENKTRGRGWAFEFPVTNLICGRELITEELQIVVCDAANNERALKLTGACQLELVREFLGRKFDVIFDVNFTKSGNSGLYLKAGWCAAEDPFTWTLGTESSLSIDVNSNAGIQVEGSKKYVLQLTVSAMLCLTKHASQRLEILLQGESLGSLYVDAPHSGFYELSVPQELVESSPTLEFRFFSPNAIRPDDLWNNGDTRLLGFAFKRMRLVRYLSH